MYRRLEASLPPDFKLPHDLAGLGYFVDATDRIRMIDEPEQPFQYRVSKNERYVELNREAMNACQNKIVLQRLHDAGMVDFRLPLGAGPKDPHVPILVSKNLGTCRRAIVFIGESRQDLGTLAGRLISSEGNNVGSLVNFTHDALEPSKTSARGSDDEDDNEVGLIVANPGQLLWHNRSGRALSFQSWAALPRKYAVSSPTPITARNHIPRNNDKALHAACLFEDIVAPLIAGAKKTKVDVIVVDDMIDDVLHLLDRTWKTYAAGVEAIVVASPNVYRPGIEGQDFRRFWGERARAYVVSDAPPGTPLTGRSEFGCNVYSSGAADFVECVVPRAYREMLSYFEHKVNDIQPDGDGGNEEIDGENHGADGVGTRERTTTAAA